VAPVSSLSPMVGVAVSVCPSFAVPLSATERLELSRTLVALAALSAPRFYLF